MSREFDDEKLNVLLEDQEWDGLLEEDDDFDAAVKEEYIKEAEELEKSLFPEGIPQMSDVSAEETRASYEKFVAQLKREGIYKEDSPADSVAEGDLSDSRSTMAFAQDSMAFVPGGNGLAGFRLLPRTTAVHERRRSIFGQSRGTRAASIVAACVLGVFLTCMTSEANRLYFVQTVKYLIGKDIYIAVDNIENDETMLEETEIRKEIEQAIGIRVPEITYRPESFKFHNFYFQEDAAVAWLKYMYNDAIMTLYMYNYDLDSTSQGFSLHGNGKTTTYIESENIEVTIIETVGEGGKNPSYTAQWVWDNVIYRFSGQMEKDIFENIITTMKYY